MVRIEQQSWLKDDFVAPPVDLWTPAHFLCGFLFSAYLNKRFGPTKENVILTTAVLALFEVVENSMLKPLATAGGHEHLDNMVVDVVAGSLGSVLQTTLERKNNK